jgi:hypothetical protein
VQGKLPLASQKENLWRKLFFSEKYLNHCNVQLGCIRVNNVYVYKGEVGVTSLAMIDDLICPDELIYQCQEVPPASFRQENPKLNEINWELEKVDERESCLQNLDEVFVESQTLEKQEDNF